MGIVVCTLTWWVGKQKIRGDDPGSGAKLRLMGVVVEAGKAGQDGGNRGWCSPRGLDLRLETETGMEERL